MSYNFNHDFDIDIDIDIDSIEIDIDEKDERKHNVSRKAMIKYANLITKSVRYLEEIADFDLPEGTQYRIVTTKNMNALTAIYALLQNHEPEEIIIAIYRMNQPAVAKIISLSETVPISVLISSFFRENKKYENWTRMLINAAKDNPNLTVKSTWSHAKVTLIKTKCGKHIVFEGSGNLSDNARIEQYILENNKQAYEFHKNWIIEAMNEDKQA